MDLYARYGPALFRKACRILQNEQDARDVVQNVFLDLWQRGDEMSPDLPYLYKVVTYRCLSVLRDEGNRRRLLERQSPTLRGPVRTPLEDKIVSLDLLLKLVRDVDQTMQELLIYRYFDDLSLDEISALLDISRKTLAKRLAELATRAAELAAEGGAHD